MPSNEATKRARALRSRVHVSIEDLMLASDWCTSYEAGEDDDNDVALARVARWLDAEVARRELDATARTVVRDAAISGRRITMEQARQAVRRVRDAKA